MSNKEKALSLHRQWKGKIEVISRVRVDTKEDLSVAYNARVAEPCKEIQKKICRTCIQGAAIW